MAKKAKNVKKSEGKTSTRKLGALRGKIFISEDFDAPLPDEILDAFEGRLDSEDAELKETRELPLPKKSGPPKKAGPTG